MARPERHPALRDLRSELLSTLRRYGARGTLLIAPEGINGTICYPFPPPPAESTDGAHHENGATHESLEEEDPVASYLKSHPLFGGPGLRTRLSVWREDEDGRQAFHRLKVKVKAEIVTLGLGRPLVDRRPVDRDESRETVRRVTSPTSWRTPSAPGAPTSPP